ncbi:MAG TPA: radical SAM family heme chaperone HemW, partial [Spirochaetota bacterium]
LPAVRKEIDLRAGYLSGEQIETIYIGGGTPSLIGSDETEEIIRHIRKIFHLTDNPEITVEANPDDLTDEYAKALRATSVNRLSIGIQSFHDADLKYLGRSHNAEKALRSIKTAQTAGFENLTIDLIYGTPTLDDAGWANNIARATDLGIQHISAYALTVECDTALEQLIKRKKREDVDDEKAARQFEILMRTMQSNGYIHYEISNFCREGFLARHNSSYWKGIPYLGIGASAHSYDGLSRQWNMTDSAVYVEEIGKGVVPCEREELSLTRRYNEYIMTSLRTIWGTSLEHITTRFGDTFRDNCVRISEKYAANGEVIIRENMLFLSDAGKLIADKITSDLFMI